MKTKEQLQTMYDIAKTKYEIAKDEFKKITSDDKCLWVDVRTAKENLDFRSTQLRMLEAILEVPVEYRILNSNPLSVE